MAPTDPTLPSIRKPRRGDRLEASFSSYDRRGLSVGRSGEYQVRLRGAVPGDRWLVDVSRRRGNRIDARGVERLEPGPHRVTARCAHSVHCGGCSFQECDYAEQLRQKRRLVREALGAAEVEPVLGADPPWAYRNKMEYTFGSRRWTLPGEPEGVPVDFALGLHAPGRFDKVIDLSECRIVFEGGEALLADARRLAKEHGLEPWDVREHRGFLRHLVLRKGFRTGEVMVDVVTSSESRERFDPFAEGLLASHPEITTLVQTVHSGVASVAYGEAERVVHGPGFITEELGGLRFAISARSFFQVNTAQAERLFELVVDEAAPRTEGEGAVLFDLYSGAGTIALLAARRVREVLAFEQVPEAVADARRNAARNGLAGVRFLQGDVLALLDGAIEEPRTLPRPDVCVVDPPRAGLHPKVPPKLVVLSPQRIVYVSCNVHAAAADLAVLAEGGYRLVRAQPLDLFPHTPHVECVLTLERRHSRA